jgi:hypothetical protein
MVVGLGRQIDKGSVVCSNVLEHVENPFGNNDRAARDSFRSSRKRQHVMGGRIGTVIKQCNTDDAAYKEQAIILQLVQHRSFYLVRPNRDEVCIHQRLGMYSPFGTVNLHQFAALIFLQRPAMHDYAGDPLSNPPTLG